MGWEPARHKQQGDPLLTVGSVTWVGVKRRAGKVTFGPTQGRSARGPLCSSEAARPVSGRHRDLVTKWAPQPNQGPFPCSTEACRLSGPLETLSR